MSEIARSASLRGSQDCEREARLRSLPPELASDGVRPTMAGYRGMVWIVQRAIDEALAPK